MNRNYVEDSLPKDGQCVLAHEKNDRDYSTYKPYYAKNAFCGDFRVVKFIKGLSEERKVDLRTSWRLGDEGFGNELPYIWDWRGSPGSYNGQDVDYWFDLSELEGE